MQYVDAIALNLSPSAALTADAYSQTVELGRHRCVTLYLDVTSVSASDTLDCSIECSDDNVTWRTAVVTFTQNTAASAQYKTFVAGRYIRALFDVTGSGISIVCTLTGEAV